LKDTESLNVVQSLLSIQLKNKKLNLWESVSELVKSKL